MDRESLTQLFENLSVHNPDPASGKKHIENRDRTAMTDPLEQGYSWETESNTNGGGSWLLLNESIKLFISKGQSTFLS